MGHAHIRKLAAAAGIGGVLAALLGQALVLNEPTISQPPAEIQGWAADHRGLMLAAVYLLAGGFALQVLFWVHLGRHLRRRVGESGALVHAGVAAAVVLVTLVIAGSGFSAELAFRGAQLTDQTAQALNDITFIEITLSDWATALALACFAVAILDELPMPRWLAWVGLAAAGVHLVAAGSFAHEGFFSPQGIGVYVGPPLYYAWVVAASILMWRDDSSPAPAT